MATVYRFTAFQQVADLNARSLMPFIVPSAHISKDNNGMATMDGCLTAHPNPPNRGHSILASFYLLNFNSGPRSSPTLASPQVLHSLTLVLTSVLSKLLTSNNAEGAEISACHRKWGQ